MSNPKIILYHFFVLLVFFGLAANLHAAGGEFEKGMAEFKEENYEEALTLFEKAYKENPNDPRVTFQLGLTHREIQNFSDSARFFRETLSIDPKAAEAKFLLADILYNTGKYEESLGTVNEAIKINVNPPQSHYLKGLILLKLKRNREAVEEFKKAKELDPSLMQQADFQIATAYVQEKEFKKASEIFKGLITVDPTSDWALFSKEYLDALEKAPPPYRLNFSFGYQYDDNVLAVPIDQSLVDVARQKDWKRIYSLFGEYTIYSKAQWNIKTSYSLNITQYNKSDYPKTSSNEKVFSQDTITHNFSVMPSYNTEKSITSLLLSYSYLEVDYTLYQQVFMANPAYTFVIKGNHLGQISLRYKKDEYNSDYFGIKFGGYQRHEENRVADNLSAGAGYFYTFLNGNGLFSVKVEGDVNEAKGSNWDYSGIKVSSGLLYPFLNNRLKANLFAELYHQDFSHRHSTYGKERQDDTTTIQTSLTYTIIKPLDISMGYTHIADDSNISVYKYRKNLYTLNIEYTF
jgi:tetratricopeptide (TPR) repeat protein